MHPPITDEQILSLVPRCQRGEAAALEQLYDLYADRLFRYLLARTGDGEIAADLLVDNTLKAQRLSVEWREPNGPRPDIAFNGTVQQLPAQGLEGQWRVSGRTVNVTAATAIDQSKGPVEVGVQVRVVGRQEQNQVQALRITVLDCGTNPCPPMILLRGRIQSLPPSGLLGVWTIDGQRVRVNQRTRLVNGQNAHIGALVELGAFQPPQGAPIALWLRVHAGGSPIVEIEQEVQAAE